MRDEPFADVIGQDTVKSLLCRLWRRHTLPQALVLEGRRSTGRLSLTRSLARLLLCDDPTGAIACGTCSQCRISLASHPDVVELGREPSALLVDTIRQEIVEQASMSPLQAKRRIFIIPQIEQMQPTAANALLKVLEEPAPHTHLLMTKAPGRTVLPTIMSRVQCLRLGALRTEHVTAILRKNGCDPLTAEARAKLSDGSHHIGAAAAEIERCPLEELGRLMQQGLDQGLIAELCDQLPSQSPEAGTTDAAWQRQVCGLWLDHLLVDIRRRLRRTGSQRLLDQVERVLLVRDDLRRNLAPRSIFERLALGP
jgi:hypothetical protein